MKFLQQKYHGGKLNGVDCHEVMSQAKSLFFNIKTLLLSISHPDRCSDDTIINHCNILQYILVSFTLKIHGVHMQWNKQKDLEA
jgi:hypothetical protein